MEFTNSTHNAYLAPQFDTLDKALEASTHMGIGAHQDDLEVMAGHGILECYKNSSKNFFGVTCTDGSGSARSGKFKNFTDKQMIEVRKHEQIKSAQMGEYAGVVQLGYPSRSIKETLNINLLAELKRIIETSQPEFIYTHNPADKHATHVAVTAHVVQALRSLNYQPKAFYGCEVWRGLDWLPDSLKIPLEISEPQLIEDLIACHQSQTAGGKRYDLASVGRMKANATFFESHKVDDAQNLWFAIDLMPLLTNRKLTLFEFVNSPIEAMKNEIQATLEKFQEG